MTVTADQLATMLTAPRTTDGDRYNQPRGTCRAPGCREPLDAVLIDDPTARTGLHIGCVDPAPIPTAVVAPAPLFSAPAGPPPAHPLKAELIRMIRWAESNSSRSLQRAIGPSEIGVDCLRRIAYRVLDTATVNDTADPWFAIVGSAVHDWLWGAISHYQHTVLDRHARVDGDDRRWLLEERLTITADEHGVSGSCDLYDADEARVIDHKIVGATALKKYTADGPSNQYRVQIHLYGLGWLNAGRPVREVAIAFYPRSDYLDKLHVWSEPFQPKIALDALHRLATVRQLATALPPALIPAAPDPAACAWCPWYRPGGPADATGCPGPLKEARR